MKFTALPDYFLGTAKAVNLLFNRCYILKFNDLPGFFFSIHINHYNIFPFWQITD
jgi:hypothetical protein